MQAKCAPQRHAGQRRFTLRAAHKGVNGAALGQRGGRFALRVSDSQPMYFTSHRLMAGNSNSTSVRTVSLIRKGITPL